MKGKKLNKNRAFSFSSQKYNSKSAPTFPQWSPEPKDRPSHHEDTGRCWGCSSCTPVCSQPHKNSKVWCKGFICPLASLCSAFYPAPLAASPPCRYHTSPPTPTPKFFQVLHHHVQPQGAVLSPKPANPFEFKLQVCMPRGWSVQPHPLI